MLKLKEDARTAAFKAVRERLKADPVLRSIFPKIRSQHPPEPSASDIPYMVLGMKTGANRVGSPQAHVNTMVIGIDYVVSASGTNEETAWEDIANLYGQIEEAIGPFENAAWLKDRIAASRRPSSLVGSPRMSVAGYTTIPLPGINAIGSTCTIEIDIKIAPCKGA